MHAPALSSTVHVSRPIDARPRSARNAGTDSHEHKRSISASCPATSYEHIHSFSAGERVANVSWCGVRVVVHRRIPEGRSELFPSGTSMLVEHLDALGHLREGNGRVSKDAILMHGAITSRLPAVLIGLPATRNVTITCQGHGVNETDTTTHSLFERTEAAERVTYVAKVLNRTLHRTAQLYCSA